MQQQRKQGRPEVVVMIAVPLPYLDALMSATPSS